MAKKESLHKAKKAKADEFYTIYSDISSELGNYRQHLKGKVVYCNCDDPTRSNFWRFFHNNFRSLSLKKLIASHYAEGEQESYALIYEGGDDFHMEEGEVLPIHADQGYPEKENTYCAGDFRSQDCIRLLEEADIVCTNPPFSLFREYVSQLMAYDKHFVVLGNQNAVTYKEIFPLIKENKIWYGQSIHSGDRKFYVPDSYELHASGCGIDEDGKRFIRVKGVRWFTNLDIKIRHDGLWHIGGKFDRTKAHKYYEGHEWKYPKYDNYDAINVDKTKEIPIDYSGVMGVPITWLDKYNPDEFKILGCSANPEGNELVKQPRSEKAIQLIKEGRLIGAKSVGGNSNIYIDSENYVHVLYHRIFIQNKNPISKADDKEN